MIKAKINVSKIDKALLFKGEKGTWLDICLIETPTSTYGDYMIVQDRPKEDRLAGKKGEIIGNAKILAKAVSPKEPEVPPDAPSVDSGFDSVPF